MSWIYPHFFPFTHTHAHTCHPLLFPHFQILLFLDQPVPWVGFEGKQWLEYLGNVLQLWHDFISDVLCWVFNVLKHISGERLSGFHRLMYWDRSEQGQRSNQLQSLESRLLSTTSWSLWSEQQFDCLFSSRGFRSAGDKHQQHVAVGFFTCKLALLNFLAFQTQRPRPGFPIQLWVGVYFLIIRESGWHFFQDSQLFFRVLLRFYPTDSQKAIFFTMVPAYQCSVLEFSGLEGTNLIDFFPPSLSPLTVRGLSG